MLTTDFTGTYDYEKAEADHAAAYILEGIAEGEYTADELPRLILKELAHWTGALGGAESASFQDFKRHFIAALAAAGIKVQS